MNVCCCTLAGTAACIGCPNNSMAHLSQNTYYPCIPIPGPRPEPEPKPIVIDYEKLAEALKKAGFVLRDPD